MGFDRAKCALTWSVAAIGIWAQPGAAQNTTADAIKEAAVIDVPFVLTAVDTDGTSTTLWAKGDKPANPLLARISIRPVQVAKMSSAAPGGAEQFLWRAFAGNGMSFMRADELDLIAGPRYFCGNALAGAALVCFIDKDGNGSFDHFAQAMPERGRKPYHVTVIKAVKPMTTPQPYRIIADDERPTITVALNNCGKDYDRPRFAALSLSDRNVPVSSSAFGWHEKDSSFASCRRGSQLASVPDSTAVAPDGGYLGQVGPLAFAVGPKQNPHLVLLGPVDRQTLYRLEGASLVDMSVGRTPEQAQLIARKKFPYPELMADAGAVIYDGRVQPGEKLATVPFHHAYRGRLTQDISISTLLGKRSLPAGTVVYGFPAQSRITFSRGGIPDMQAVDDDEYRKINLELTWCAPVQGTEPATQKTGAIGRGGWSAACIPYSTIGNHTIITDLQPAFSVTGVSYDVATSSNDGPPPILRDDNAAFEQSLRLEYVFRERREQAFTLEERVYFGTQLASSKPLSLFAPAGRVVAEIAGAQVELGSGENGELTARSTSAPVTGANPILRWDQRAYFLDQLRKMGLKPVEREDETDPAADAPMPIEGDLPQASSSMSQ